MTKRSNNFAFPIHKPTACSMRAESYSIVFVTSLKVSIGPNAQMASASVSGLLSEINVKCISIFRLLVAVCFVHNIKK